MAKQILTNVRYFVGPADLTTQSNKVEWDDTMEEKDVTNFGSNGAKEIIAGIESLTIAAEFFYQAGDPGYADEEWWNARRIIEAHSLAPVGTTVGSPGYLTQAVRLAGTLFGSIGDVAMAKLGAAGSWPMARGAVLTSPGAAIAANGNGASVTMDAVAATQRLYASLHVLSVSGTSSPTLAVTIESDDDSGFPSATTQLTFTTTGAIGSEAIRGSTGAITDTFYRAKYVVSGTNPSFLALVVLGIAT